ncbi:MAG: N-6 DNA methylase [PVC group bacterium]
MKAPDKVKRLVDVFDRNLEAYKRSGYKEANVRSEFIDPFFEALGWDVHNKQGYAEAYKDVITEDAIKVGGVTKAPDYCFRIGGGRKFFVEAKKPSVDIKGEISPAYQLRRYAWSAGLPLSILTDFEEFAVYDCRLRPRLKDKSGNARVIYLTYKDYPEKWVEIGSIFSKQAVLEGLFDKYVESKGKRTTQEVDSEFLKEIENWRTLLARTIALRNPSLGIREINFAVQRTIDRIIFLRICEDRGIEFYGQLQALLNGANIYERLTKIYRLADDKYNSGLFHFHREQNLVTPPDELTLGIKIDDKVLKEIFKQLYYPESPYEFSVLSVAILGNIYEQFLGKVITLTKGHQAKVEEKPEVRKAGGVYYTPTYIVDYIVKNTVGKLCEGKTPKQIEKLRILDPACGSGSFLIGAYNYLNDYHRDWYLANLIPGLGHEGYISKTALRKYVPGQKPEMPIYQGKGGQWYLTTREKKRILLNNIYGVDIDSQAVEVTKLSLLLKVLENENQDTLERQMKLWRERALPDLGNNIKCGNSLIGPDIFEMDQSAAPSLRGAKHSQSVSLRGADLSAEARRAKAEHRSNLISFTPEDSEKINAFDWHTEFPEIFSSSKPSSSGRGKKGEGGFDAVIGNPPYIGFHGFKDEKSYLKSHFVSASGKFDIYLTFIERGVALVRSGGYIGYICPTNFMKRDHGSKLRVHLKDNVLIREICDFEDVQIFKGALNYTGVFVFERNRPSRTHAFIYKRRSLADAGIRVQQVDLSADAWVIRRAEANFVVRRVSQQRCRVSF